MSYRRLPAPGVTRRMVPRWAIAAHLGLADPTFCKIEPQLRLAGFPQPDQLLGGQYDLAAVEHWLDARHHLDERSSVESAREVLEKWGGS